MVLFNNFSSDCFLKWKTLSKQDQLAVLQECENNNARLWKRTSRTVVLDPTPSTTHGQDNAHYSFETPDKIYIRDISQSLLGMYSVVSHEGFHAATYDYFNNKADLHYLFDIQKDRLLLEYQLRDIIYNFCYQRGKTLLFNLSYQEEVLARNEEYMTAVLFMFITCNSVEAFVQLLSEFESTIIKKYQDYQQYRAVVEQSMGQFDEIVKYCVANETKKNQDRIRSITTDKTLLAMYCKPLLAAASAFLNNMKLCASGVIDYERYRNQQISVYMQCHDDIVKWVAGL